MNLKTEGRQSFWLCREMCCGESGLWLCLLLGTMGCIRGPRLLPTLSREAKEYCKPSMLSVPTLCYGFGEIYNKEVKDRLGLENRRKNLREHHCTDEKTETRGGRSDFPKVIQLMNDI